MKCVASKLWANDSSYPPVYNNLLTQNWPKNHVNYTNATQGTGYRCVLNDTGSAYWDIAHLKYDWDSKESGYCNKETDCFGVPATATNKYRCIANGTTYKNHYCHLGTWTTKTYVIGSTLLELTKDKSNKVLFCDNRTNVFNDQTAASSVAAACSIVYVEGNVQKTITGFALNSEDDYTSAQGLEYQIEERYFDVMQKENALADDLNECTSLPVTPAFRDCSHMKSQTPALYLYYNSRDKYFLMSDYTITGLTQSWLDNLLNTLGTFFGRDIPTQDFNFVRTNLSYDRVYYSDKDAIIIQGMHDTKYDEPSGELWSFIYVNTTGTDNLPLNEAYLKQLVQDGNVSILQKDTSQQIYIKYNNSLMIWPYLTSYLREK